ncbi:ADP-ribosylation factor-like protein [Trypanosoma conorhini]|uniref:ADP-ribosylation factor-like protein n=1 Tax=Trypanosoma conorhini TaxID=83891 RepID=A0A3S5IRK3_9TRYP|nr:ADP-ribosylation factor-like protein [Trypanosoma conorhini]RNF07251.1 ADP-ribosylation factor-like protein [Trypanosoma conorhini]
MASPEEEKRVAYCKKHNVHHLFELLATRLLVDRPENPFEYLREMLSKVEDSEKHKHSHDPTVLAPPINGAAQPLRKITLGTFGIDNAGKTTLISALGGKIDVNTTPTVGFTPTKFQTDTYDICVFDLGGAANFRGIWVHYFHDCHGLMFVIDSAADEAVVEESLRVLRDVAQHPYVKGKPLLVLANKKDLKNARGTSVVPDGYLEDLLEQGTAHRVVASCSIKEDPDLEEGVEWLLAMVEKCYDTLEARVVHDTEAVKGENKKKAAERLAAIKTAS